MIKLRRFLSVSIFLDQEFKRYPRDGLFDLCSGRCLEGSSETEAAMLTGEVAAMETY